MQAEEYKSGDDNPSSTPTTPTTGPRSNHPPHQGQPPRGTATRVNPHSAWAARRNLANEFNNAPQAPSPQTPSRSLGTP